MDLKLPNILITGTPGTGKSTLANEVTRKCNLRYVSINDVAKEGDLYDGFDDENECHILDEDRIIDELEENISTGDNTVLYPRLSTRGYSEKKILDLIHCEIVQVVLDEARGSYKPEIVYELQSNTIADLEENSTRICNWIEEWKSKHQC